VSRNAKKSGGLSFNPLLSRTDANVEAVPLAVNIDTRLPVDMSTGEHVEPAAGSVPMKFTFYFSPEQLERLDTAWSTFRRQTRGTGIRLSKSLFVRVALDRLLDEFDQSPDQVMGLLRDQSMTAASADRVRL